MPYTTYPIQPKESPTNNLKINIGLKNNKMSPSKIIQYISLKKVFTNLKYKIIEGEYNGQKEQTLAIQGETIKTRYEIEKLINYLNTLCSQECIAYKYNNDGILQYNEFFDGKKQDFNDNYFLTF